jgi:hypothetical protein
VGVAWTLVRLKRRLSGECCFASKNIVFHESILNHWVWIVDPDTCYYVGGAYYLLTRLILGEVGTHCNIVWNKFVPLKISTFAWRHFCNRLLTKSNLVLCGCLQTDSILYSIGCGVLEDLNHLFLNCVFFTDFVWHFSMDERA